MAKGERDITSAIQTRREREKAEKGEEG